MTPAEKAAKAKASTRRDSPRRTIKWTNCLKELRSELGLTQRDVAKAIDRSDASVCHTEAGADPTLSTAVKLAVFFGKRIEEIWTALPTEAVR